MPSMTTDELNPTPVPAKDLAEKITRKTSRSRYSKGFKIVEKFLEQGSVAATVTTKDRSERNKVLASVKAYIASSQGANPRVWAKVSGPNEILLVNLIAADATTKAAYANRSKAGRPKVKKSARVVN